MRKERARTLLRKAEALIGDGKPESGEITFLDIMGFRTMGEYVKGLTCFHSMTEAERNSITDLPEGETPLTLAVKRRQAPDKQVINS